MNNKHWKRGAATSVNKHFKLLTFHILMDPHSRMAYAILCLSSFVKTNKCTVRLSGSAAEIFKPVHDTQASCHIQILIMALPTYRNMSRPFKYLSFFGIIFFSFKTNRGFVATKQNRDFHC